MTDPGQRRRATDHMPLDIEAMIINEPDTKQRAFLIVLNSINTALTVTTATVTELHTKFETHIENFDAHIAADAELRNRGKGAWQVLAWVLGMAQIASVGIWIQVRAEFAAINTALAAEHTEHALYEVRLKAMETKK